MPNKFNHPLMENNISREDLAKVIKFLKKNPILTQNKQVEKFEREWSKWLGVKYSVFVNSGSSANFITISALRDKLRKTGEIITPPLTWPSDVMAVINNGFEPKFVDINLSNLSMDNEKIINSISKKTVAVFMTHAQGFNGISKKLLDFLKKKKIHLIEDVCESHGATFNKRKLGTFGLASNFSFYFAHHLSTIEGGMICTNDKSIYDYCIRFRGHGMLRESKFKKVKNIANKFKDLNQKFIFLNPGFNFRNNEIQAVIGQNQIKKLDFNNIKRNQNFEFFFKKLRKDLYFSQFDKKGISNYAFPIILNTNKLKSRNDFEKYLLKNKIEFRRGNAGGGNQLRQPYLRKYLKNINLANFKKVEKVHHFGYYIGNYPSLTKKRIERLVSVMNKFKLN